MDYAQEDGLWRAVGEIGAAQDAIEERFERLEKLREAPAVPPGWVWAARVAVMAFLAVHFADVLTAAGELFRDGNAACTQRTVDEVGYPLLAAGSPQGSRKEQAR